MTNPTPFVHCARCEDSNASKHCIIDVQTKRTLTLFTTSSCNCELPAPVCPECHSRFRGIFRTFICNWCRKETVYTIQQKKRHERITPPSISAVIFQYNMSSSIDSSRLFRSFGMISSDFSAWRNLAKFFIQLDQPFVIHMFCVFMKTKTNTKKDCHISPTIFQLDDKICKQSAYMNRIVRMFQHFTLMITFSGRMFCMSHNVCRKYAKKQSSMICKRILSKLGNSESGFIKSLRLYYNSS